VSELGVANGRSANEPLIRPVMPELDSVRGLAILAVLFYHGFFWSQGLGGLAGPARLFVLVTLPGWLGVNLFFVLSGFLITGILLETRKRADYYKRFYVRRALRILPAYYAVLFLLAILKAASPAFLLLSFFYLSNVTPLFGVAVSYTVLWSLAVEEHFYLLWPTVIRRLSPRAVLGYACGIVVITPMIRLTAFKMGAQDGLSTYTWNVADGLAMGAILAIALREFHKDRAWLGRFSALLIVCAAALEIGGARFGILTRLRPLGASLQVTPWNFLFTAVIGVFLLAGTSPWKSFVLSPVLRFFGDISYGLYLIHLLIFEAYDSIARRYFPHLADTTGRFGAISFRFCCAAWTAIILSYLSRRYFENPVLRLKNRWSA